MRVVLARHGHTAWNEEHRCLGHRDLPLSERGRADARALAEALAGRRFARFHASDLSRAVETAAAVAGSEALVRRHPGLRELHQGALEGRPIRTMFQGHEDLGSAWARDPANVLLPGGESMRMLQDRVVRAFEALTGGRADGDVLLVSHNLSLSTLLAHITRTPLSRFAEWYHHPGAYSVVERTGRSWTVAEHNVHAHLAPMPP